MFSDCTDVQRLAAAADGRWSPRCSYRAAVLARQVHSVARTGYNTAVPLNPFIWEYAIEDGVPREPFARETALQLKAGTHVALFGPRGTGKISSMHSPRRPTVSWLSSMSSSGSTAAQASR